MPRCGMTSARPTTADVARLANVSTATVSYVLNDVEGHRISARTRDAVYRAAQQLGYRPNLAARNLARGKSGAVLYVVPRVAVGDMPLQAGSRMTTELDTGRAAPGPDLRDRRRPPHRRCDREHRSRGRHEPVPVARASRARHEDRGDPAYRNRTAPRARKPTRVGRADANRPSRLAGPPRDRLRLCRCEEVARPWRLLARWRRDRRPKPESYRRSVSATSPRRTSRRS